MNVSSEILRIVDAIHRERDIAKEIIFVGIESALETAAMKRFGKDSAVEITIDRENGSISAVVDGEPLDPNELGRIAALNAKQIIMQKIREAERDVVYNEFEEKVGTVVTAVVSRFEGPNVIVNISNVEAVLPKKEQIYSENYQVGDRLKFYIQEVKKVGSKVRIEVSRTHPELIRQLFLLEIPEISESLIEIRGLAREPGYRAKISVYTEDPKIDSVGACVGVRGSRIKSIVDELGGEKIDIVRWSDDPAEYIIEALKPAEITEITLDEDELRAQVLVRDESLSKAIGKRGKNVRLASKLTGWEIDIMSPESLVVEGEEGGELSEEDYESQETTPEEESSSDAETEGSADSGPEEPQGPETVEEPEDESVNVTDETSQQAAEEVGEDESSPEKTEN